MIFNHLALLRSIIIGTVLFHCIALHSQEISDAQVKAALVYNFLKFIEWEDEFQPDTIELGIYGIDDAIIASFSFMDGKESKNKPIKLFFFQKPEDLQPVDILYINQGYRFDPKRVRRAMKDYPTLLITDRHENKRDIMINFYHDQDNRVKFELNNKNIKEAGISTSPKLLLLGGTELDIRELYEEVEQSLISEKEKTSTMEQELMAKEYKIDTLTDNLDDLSRFIRSQKLIIAHQHNLIEDQQEDLKRVEIELNELQQQKAKQEYLLDIISFKLQQKNLDVQDLDSILLIKQIEYDSSMNTLSVLNNEIRQVQAELDETNLRLNLQRWIIYVSIAFLILFVIFIVYLYLSTRRSKRKNLELEQNNIMINEQKDRIVQQAESLIEINAKLEKQKQLLQDALNKLKGAQSQLVASERLASLGQLTAGIIHEINNPINFINSSVEGFEEIVEDFAKLVALYDAVTPENFSKKIKEIDMFKNDMDYAESKEGIAQLSDNIRFGISRTKEIISSLRTFSRMDEDEFVSTDINESINTAIVLLGNMYKGRIRLKKEYGNLPKVECMAGKMNQVYLNLLVNAIQAIKDEGEIKISTAVTEVDSDEMVKITIQDTGSGIPERILNQIFDPFFTTKEVGKGTGLGLSITYSIIQKHEGTIDVKSTPGKGTIFTIHLPVKKKSEQKHEA